MRAFAILVVFAACAPAPSFAASLSAHDGRAAAAVRARRGRGDTRALLDRFLALVPDFAIAATPTLFAAGDDVITESIEHMTFQGRAITLHGLDVKHFVDGRVTREWQYANGAEAMTALLGLPPLAVP